MPKPEGPITSDPRLDYGIAERVARCLSVSGSSLMVYDAQVASSVPDALAHRCESVGGGAAPGGFLIVELTLITDGERGWLVLAPFQSEYDVEVEVTELLEELTRYMPSPQRFVVRAASRRPRLPPGVLDLEEDIAAAGRWIDAEHARCFASAPRARTEDFLRPFVELQYALRDEQTIRRTMIEATK